MNLNKIKDYIKSIQNDKLIIKVNVGRNKCEYFEGIITKCYSNVFIFETNNLIKSFTYTDVMIKHINIKVL